MTGGEIKWQLDASFVKQKDWQTHITIIIVHVGPVCTVYCIIVMQVGYKQLNTVFVAYQSYYTVG